MAIDLERIARVDDARRACVASWLERAGLPAVPSGSYYVKGIPLGG
jgi:uncharacterized protein YggL (DUF469 family)